MTSPAFASARETTVAYEPGDDELVVERDGDALLVGTVAPNAPPAIDASVELRPGDAHVDVRMRLANRGDDPVALDDVSVVDATETAFDDDATETAFDDDAAVYWHGYQSWTPTATLPVGDRFAPESAEQQPQMCDLAAPLADARRDASHGVVGFVPDRDPASSLVLAFLDHDRYVTRFDVIHDDRGVHAVDAVCPLEGEIVDPGESLSLPTLRVDATRPLDDALAGVADAIAERMDARVLEAAPTGWCSWYHYFTSVTADDVRENLASLADWGVDLGVVQLDDGYQTAFGDWTTLADGFDEPGALVDDVRAAGRDPGLWLAPFYVEADSDLARSHPEWLVTDDAGEPVSATPRHGPMYALDATHPAVESWLRRTFETIVDDWGFAYLKLDFLYAAALPGNRHDAAATRAEAYRRGLGTIRDAVGDDVTILGCGAPQFQSVGLVDAMRVGPDTAPHWRDAPESQPAHENAIRNVLNRQWTHRRLFTNDPDCQLVRETTDLSTAERRSFAAVVSLLGGSSFVSDRVADIGAAGRELVERSLPPVETGRVADLGGRELPATIVTERDADDALAVARFNWTDEPRTVRADPADHGFPDAHVWDAWRETPVGTGAYEREIPAHGCLLVHVAASAGRPRLHGSDHLANLAAQVEHVDWRDETLHVALDADRPRTTTLVAPGEWTPVDGSRRAAERIEPGDDHWTTTLSPGENAIEFEKP